MITKDEFFSQYKELNKQLTKTAFLLLIDFMVNPENLNKSQKELAIELGKCRATINRSIKQLVEQGHIEYDNKFSCKHYITINDKKLDVHSKPVDGFLKDIDCGLDLDLSNIDTNSKEYKEVIDQYRIYCKGAHSNIRAMDNIRPYLFMHPEHLHYIGKLFEARANIRTGDVNVWKEFSPFVNKYNAQKNAIQNVTPNAKPASDVEKKERKSYSLPFNITESCHEIIEQSLIEDDSNEKKNVTPSKKPATGAESKPKDVEYYLEKQKVRLAKREFLKKKNRQTIRSL